MVEFIETTTFSVAVISKGSMSLSYGLTCTNIQVETATEAQKKIIHQKLALYKNSTKKIQPRQTQKNRTPKTRAIQKTAQNKQLRQTQKKRLPKTEEPFPMV